MAAYHGNPLHDLELLIDNNIRRATSNSAWPPPPPPFRHSREGTNKVIDEVTAQLAPELIGSPSEPLRMSAPNAPPLVPVPAAASLSLALGSMLSSNFLISNSGFRNSPHNRVSPNPPAPVARNMPTLPSQKKCIRPMPILPAVRGAVGVDVPRFAPMVGSKKSAKFTTAFPDYLRLSDKIQKSSDPCNGAALRKASIVWFRNDLRVHDNEALFTASKESLSILPVYCFDPRDYGKSSSGFDKTGPYRVRFLLECIANLRENLRKQGSDLVIRVGKPEEVLVSLAKSIGADALYAHQEVSCDEIQSENKVAAVLGEEGVDVKYFWGSTLFHIEDLPFKLGEMPTTYSGFREKVQSLKVRETIEAPKRLKALPSHGGVKPGDMPTPQELGLKPSSAQHQELPVFRARNGCGRNQENEADWTLDLAIRLNQGCLEKNINEQSARGTPLVGGEMEALQRLKSFTVEHLKQSSGNLPKDGCGDSLFGANFSCKISPWLAMGCLSPRCMFQDLKRDGRSIAMASASTTEDNGLNGLMFELLWRDFFRFITKKYGSGKKVPDEYTATDCIGAVPV